MEQKKLDTKIILERAKLLMKYDNSKTLTENLELISEQVTLSQSNVHGVSKNIRYWLSGDVTLEDLTRIQTELESRIFGNMFETGGCAMIALLKQYSEDEGTFNVADMFATTAWMTAGFSDWFRSKNLISAIESSGDYFDSDFKPQQKRLLNAIQTEMEGFCKKVVTQTDTEKTQTDTEKTQTEKKQTNRVKKTAVVSQYKNCANVQEPTLYCKNNSVVSKVQGCLGITADGAFGPKTKAALEAKSLSGDKITQDTINKVCKTQPVQPKKQESPFEDDDEDVTSTASNSPITSDEDDMS